MLDASFKAELEKLSVFLNHHGKVGKRGGGHSDFGHGLLQDKVGPVPVLVLQALLMNAPSLSAAADLLNTCTNVMVGGDLSPLYSSGRGAQPFTDSALQFLIENIDFSSLLIDRQREVEALIKIVHYMPNQKMAVSVICEVLNKESFMMDVCPELIKLFGTVLIDSPCVRPQEKSRTGGLGDDYDCGPAESSSAAPHIYGTIPQNNAEVLKLKATMLKWIARVSRNKGVGTDSPSMDCEGVDENLVPLTGAIKMWGAQLSSLNLSFPKADKGYGRDEVMSMLGRDKDAMDITDDDGMEAMGEDDDDDDDESRGPSREGRDGGRMRMRDHGMGGMMGNRNDRKRGGMGSGLLSFGWGGSSDSRSKPKRGLPSAANRDKFLLDTWAWLASSQFESLCDSHNAEAVLKGLSSLCPAACSQESPSCPLLHLTMALADGLGASAIKLNEPAVAASALLSNYDNNITSTTFRDVTQGILLHLVCARNISQMRQLLLDSRFWGLCLNWIQTETKEQETRSSSKLRDVLNKVFRMYTDLSTRILSFDVTIGDIKWLYKLNADLDVIWQIVNSQLWSGEHTSGTVTGIAIMNDWLTEYHDKATNLEQVMSALMPSNKLYEWLQTLLEPSKWDTLTLVNIRKLLCYPDMPNALPSTVSSLPPHLVSHADWFLTCIEGRILFQKFFTDRWNDDFDKIPEICDEWVKFCSRFADDTVTFEALADYGELLLDEGEVETLVSTAASYLSQRAQGSITLPDASKIATVVKQWSDLRKIFNHEAKIGAVLEASAAHLAPNVKPLLASLKSTLKELCAEVRRKGKWEKQTTAVLAKYWKENKAAEVDARLVDISDELLKTMTVHEDLLTWLRTQKDDDGFTNRVEYARGLQEMNTPIELWDSANGRVNDKFLSMLRNVRSYLHGYLYAELPSAEWSFDDFINVFTSVNKKTVVSVICKNIEECGKKLILKALQQVVGCSAAKAGLSRLVRLYDTGCRSSWICRTGEEVENGDAPPTSGSTGIGASVIKSYVTLRFCVETVEDEVQESVDAMDTDAVLPDEEHAASWRYHSYQELLDFQSGIVLERDMSKDIQNLRTSLLVDEETSKEDTIVDSFLTQFSWIRRLGEVLQKLHEAGHFSYFPTYNQEISLNVPDAEYRSVVVEYLEAQLESWLLCVKEVRLRYYFANFFDLKRFYGLKKLLPEGATSSVSMDRVEQQAIVEQLANGLGDYICFINSNLACDASTRIEVAAGLLESWQRGLAGHAELLKTGTGMKMTSEITLDLIASSVNGAFAQVPRRYRSIILDDMDQTVVADRLKRGVYVVQAVSRKEEFDMCLTLSSIHGAFPEWENCLVCSPETSWENVLLLLLRWHGAWANGRENGMFCLVDVESLTYGTYTLYTYSMSILALPSLTFDYHTLCRRSTPSGTTSARVRCATVT